MSVKVGFVVITSFGGAAFRNIPRAIFVELLLKFPFMFFLRLDLGPGNDGSLVSAYAKQKDNLFLAIASAIVLARGFILDTCFVDWTEVIKLRTASVMRRATRRRHGETQ